MITKEEALAIAEICDTWPGGLGCVLIPAPDKKHGRKYKNGGWGWSGKVANFHNFDYSKLSSFPEGTIFCPVTALGRLRNFNGFKGHMKSYILIRQVIKEKFQEDDNEAKHIYNYLLRKEPKKLAEIFREYAKSINEEK